MRRAATTLIAAAALATLALGGCAAGAGTPGEAAQVGDQVITQSTLTADTAAFSGLMEQLGGTQPSPTIVLSMEVRGVLAGAIEQASGTVIEETELAPRLTELGLALYQNPDTKSLVIGTTKLALLQEKAQAGEIDPQVFVQVLVTTEVSVNPRYGEWLVDQQAVVDQTGVLASPLS